MCCVPTVTVHGIWRPTDWRVHESEVVYYYLFLSPTHSLCYTILPHQSRSLFYYLFNHCGAMLCSSTHSVVHWRWTVNNKNIVLKEQNNTKRKKGYCSRIICQHLFYKIFVNKLPRFIQFERSLIVRNSLPVESKSSPFLLSALRAD